MSTITTTADNDIDNGYDDNNDDVDAGGGNGDGDGDGGDNADYTIMLLFVVTITLMIAITMIMTTGPREVLLRGHLDSEIRCGSFSFALRSFAQQGHTAPPHPLAMQARM